MPDVSVATGLFNDIRIETIAEVEEMEELVVPGDLEKTSETGLLAERQGATAVLDTIGADLISKLGASTAGDALKRMVGTSVVDGKYVVVRGLSDRYVNTLMNGGRLPSSDPDKRAINVDLFPGPTLESINTTKTFTPDQPGDFTGGSVDIRTKQFPDKPSFGASATVEYNSQATFNPDYLTYAGGGTGPFGFRANQREIPQSVINNTNMNSLDPKTLNADEGNLAKAESVNSSMRQMSSVVGLTNKTPGPNYSFNMQGGDSVDYGPDQKIGSFGAFSYRHKNIYNPDTTRGNYSIQKGGIKPNFLVVDNKASEDVLWGGLANFSVQPEKDQRVAINVIFNQQATDTSDFQYANSGSRQLQYTSIQYSERQLGYVQLNGNHKINAFRDIDIDWVGGFGQAQLNEPDQRLFQSAYDPTTGSYTQLLPSDPSFTADKSPLQRYQRQLTEGEYNAIANISVPYFEEKDNPSKFKTGFYIDTTQRDYNQANFVYKYGGTTYPDDYQAYNQAEADGQSWSDVFLNENRSGLVNPTGQGKDGEFMSWTASNDSAGQGSYYNAYQQVLASYVMTDFRLFPQLTFTGGTRFENTNIQVEGPKSTLFPTAAAATANIQELDLLPAAGATFQIMPEINLRLAWSQTIARPSFKEMGPVVTQDFSDATIFVGNPKLKLSHVNNYDVRIEYFPRGGEVIAVSGFYKSIKAPIEQSIFQLGDTQFYQYKNNQNGTLWGSEFEARKRLDQCHEYLKNFSANFNATYVQSQVPLDAEQQRVARTFVGNYSTSRPLQGQPLYIINAGLSYDDQPNGFFAGLFYNVTGPYLYAVGRNLPDIYEQPAPSLDFNLTQEFADHWAFTLRGKNLLNPVFRQTITYQGTEVDYLAYTKGYDVSLGLKYGF
jgi:TonB-dependent receptor